MDAFDLPDGVVTFLFTDIEGSTRLWEGQPAAMEAALARHDALLRTAIEANHGHVIKSMGDGLFAAFGAAQDAVAAALACQRALLAADWSELPRPIRVRMGLHTGEAAVRDRDYFGPVLNRTARLMSIAAGGQVLLSAAAAERVRDQMLAGAGLRDLGQHRLKDLIRPEHIFQLTAPGLPVDFPPLRSLDLQLNNLPVQLTSFIGRQAELIEVRRLLADAHLLTLTGPGGIGKTRLALQAAADLLDDFPDGVWLVELAALSDPGLIDISVASTWNLREQPDRSPLAALLDYLQSRALLLILDNCEHLVDACARLASVLAGACPRLKILATSRETLGIPGEVIYRVASLSLLDPARSVTDEPVSNSEAVQLFIDRARAARPGFVPTAQTLPAIAHVCRQLDGIPLALELAAARLGSFTVEQLVARLDDRFRLLAGGSRAALPRQQTLQAAIDWSYNLLTGSEQLLLQRLSIFSGGWTLDAAEQVCAGDGIDALDIFELLAHLVGKSLVNVDLQQEEPRYTLLETIRQYAVRALAAGGDPAPWRQRHLAFYLDLAETAGLALYTAEDILWLPRLEADHDNLRSAIETAVRSGDIRAVLRFNAALYYFWNRRGHLQEGRRQLERAAALEGASEHPLEYAGVLAALGVFHWFYGEFLLALQRLQKATELAGALGEPGCFVQALSLAYQAVTYVRMQASEQALQVGAAALEQFTRLQQPYGIAFSNFALGRVYIERGDMSASWPNIQQAYEWVQRSGDRTLSSLVLNSMQLLCIATGDTARALQFNRQALEISRQLDDAYIQAAVLRETGNLALVQGELTEAASAFDESGRLSRQQGLESDYARSCYSRGMAAAWQGDLETAMACFCTALAGFQKAGLQRGQAECLDGFALLAALSGQPELSARLLGAADAALASLDIERWPVDVVLRQKLLARLHASLPLELFDQAYRSGQALALADALAQGQGLGPALANP